MNAACGHAVPELPDGTAARCTRCGATMHRFRAGSLDHAFAYACAGLVLFLMANLLPFISLETSGRVQSASLGTGISALYHQGLWELAAVVALTMLVAPGLRLGTLVLVLGGLRLEAPAALAAAALPLGRSAGPWAMVEVYHPRRLRRLCEANRPRHHHGRARPLFGRRADAGDHRRRHQPGHRDGVAAVRAPRTWCRPGRRSIRAGRPACAMAAAWSPTCRPEAMASARAAAPLCTAAGRTA